MALCSVHSLAVTVTAVLLLSECIRSVDDDFMGFDLFAVELNDIDNVTLSTLCIAVTKPNHHHAGQVYKVHTFNECSKTARYHDHIHLAYATRRRCYFPSQLQRMVFYPVSANHTITIWHGSKHMYPRHGYWLRMSNRTARQTSVSDEARYAHFVNRYGDGARIALLPVLSMIILATVAEAISMFYHGYLYRKGLQPPPVSAKRQEPNSRRRIKEAMAVMITLVSVVGFLLLLFFFPSPLSYIVHGMLFLICAKCQFELLQFLMGLVNAQAVQPDQSGNGENTRHNSRLRLRLTRISNSMRIKQVVLLLVSFVLPTMWLIFSYTDISYVAGFVIQNICALTLCMGIGGSLYIRRFSVITIIFIFFTLYDIFFVYVTPFLIQTRSADLGNFSSHNVFPQVVQPQRSSGVMMYVASKLNKVLVFRIPYDKSPHVCQEHLVDKYRSQGGFVAMSILGLGDVLIPLVLGNYCIRFDLRKEVNANETPTGFQFFYTAAYMALYMLTLLAASVTAGYTDHPQPALLFIIPGTLMAALAMAVTRREFKEFVQHE